MWLYFAAVVPLALFVASMAYLVVVDLLELDRNQSTGWNAFNALALSPTVAGLTIACGLIWLWSELRCSLAYDENVPEWERRAAIALDDFVELLEFFTQTLPNALRGRR